MAERQSNRETLIEARMNKIESILETLTENQMRFDKKLDRLSDELAETARSIRQTNTSVERTNTAVNMFVSAMIASGRIDSDL